MCAQLRRQGAAHVHDRSEGGYDQRQRRDHAFGFSTRFPSGFHGQRILADRNGDAQRRTQLHPHRPHGVEQAGVLAGMTGRRHPVGRQLHIPELLDARGGQIGQRLADRHSSRSRPIQHRQRRALAQRHGFAGLGIETGGGHRDIADRDLPRSDHLIPAHQPGHRAVADGDEKALVGHRREAQHARHRLVEVDAVQVERPGHDRDVGHVAHQLRRLVE